MEYLFFIISIPVMTALDALWLTVIAKNWYLQQFGSLARLKDGALAVQWPSAILVYVLLVIGFSVYVVPSIAYEKLSIMTFLKGALFGGIVYGVYDLTNHATLAQWPVQLVIGDIAWGMCLFGLTSVLTKYCVSLIR